MKQIKWTGDNEGEITEFFKGCVCYWAIIKPQDQIIFSTPHGDMMVAKGEYITKDKYGDCYPKRFLNGIKCQALQA